MGCPGPQCGARDAPGAVLGGGMCGMLGGAGDALGLSAVGRRVWGARGCAGGSGAVLGCVWLWVQHQGELCCPEVRGSAFGPCCGRGQCWVDQRGGGEIPVSVRGWDIGWEGLLAWE